MEENYSFRTLAAHSLFHSPLQLCIRLSPIRGSRRPAEAPKTLTKGTTAAPGGERALTARSPKPCGDVLSLSPFTVGL